jgi:hypothetical protein
MDDDKRQSGPPDERPDTPDRDTSVEDTGRGDGLEKDASPEAAPGPEDVVGGGFRGDQVADEA